MQIEKWMPGHVAEQFKRKNIHSIRDIQIDGKIDTKKLFEKQLPAFMANACLTAHDSNTLRPELLDLLQMSDAKPNINYKITNGEIRAFTDGSWLEKERRGTYAVVFDGATRRSTYDGKCLQQLRNGVASNLACTYRSAMEKRPAYIHGFRKPHQRYNGSVPRKRSIKKTRTRLARAVNLIKKREEIGAKTNLSFVYSHMRDEEEEEESEDEGEEENNNRARVLKEKTE